MALKKNLIKACMEKLDINIFRILAASNVAVNNSYELKGINVPETDMDYIYTRKTNDGILEAFSLCYLNNKGVVSITDMPVRLDVFGKPIDKGVNIFYNREDYKVLSRIGNDVTEMIVPHSLGETMTVDGLGVCMNRITSRISKDDGKETRNVYINTPIESYLEHEISGLEIITFETTDTHTSEYYEYEEFINHKDELYIDNNISAEHRKLDNTVVITEVHDSNEVEILMTQLDKDAEVKYRVEAHCTINDDGSSFGEGINIVISKAFITIIEDEKLLHSTLITKAPHIINIPLSEEERTKNE